MNHPAKTLPPLVERKKAAAFVLVCLLGLIVASVLAGCRTECAQGSICGDHNSIAPTSVVTVHPTPAPSASATPAESCRIDYMVLRPSDGITLAMGATGRVSLTPYQTVLNPDGTVAQREVSEACNLPRIPAIIWSSSSVAVTVGNGFEPIVTRVGVGTAVITATLEGRVSNSAEVR